jgi:cobalamin biosynthesis protein CobD/CbiB
MDTRVIKRFLGYLLWGIAWTVSLTGIIAGLVWISLTLTGGMHLFPMIAVIAAVASFGIYMLWRHAHHEIRHEDLHNLQRDKRNGRH